MNTPITFSEKGAHFRIADSELKTLNSIAKEKYDAELQALPIGRATAVLRTIILAGGFDARVENEHGNVIASSDMDGAEATIGAIERLVDPLLKHAVMDIGRVTVDVVMQEEIDVDDAVSVQSLEFVSRAYSWSQDVVRIHRDALYLDGSKTPRIPDDMISKMPERAETALALQGLVVLPVSATEDEFALVRLPENN